MNTGVYLKAEIYSVFRSLYRALPHSDGRSTRISSRFSLREPLTHSYGYALRAFRAICAPTDASSFAPIGDGSELGPQL